jgi:hypothetical protein
MRSLSLFALILTSLTLAVSAQDYKTPKSKPYHSAKEKESKSIVADNKITASKTANAQELRRLEQQTAKSSASKTAKRPARTARVANTQHERPNPPIRISSATGTHAGMTDQGKNPYKGRVRQKGNGNH